LQIWCPFFVSRRKVQNKRFTFSSENSGDERICYRGPLCQLPLSKRTAQLFSHTMKPVKNEKNCSSTETNNKRK